MHDVEMVFLFMFYYAVRRAKNQHADINYLPGEIMAEKIVQTAGREELPADGE